MSIASVVTDLLTILARILSIGLVAAISYTTHPSSTSYASIMADLLPILVHILHILRLSFYAIRASVAVTMAFVLWLVIMRPARANMHVYRGIRDVWKKHYAQKVR